MAIQQEMWVRDIAENLFRDNTLLTRSLNDNAYLQGKVVHLPQSGAKPNVEVNRTTLPAVSAKRTDTEVTYNIDEYTTDPVTIQDTEEIETSYEKRQSVLSDQIMTLEERIMDQMLFNWGPSAASGSIVRTSGADRGGFKTGQTGTRKAVAKDDIIEIRRLMDRMDIPQSNRCLCVDADMYSDILKIEDFVRADQFGGNGNIQSGVVGRLYGFDVYTRSLVNTYDNAANPAKKAVGAAAAATDNASCLAWHSGFVRMAMGSTNNGGIKVFENPNDALYYGTVISAMVRAGGRPRYTDLKGVVALVEAAGA